MAMNHRVLLFLAASFIALTSCSDSDQASVSDPEVDSSLSTTEPQPEPTEAPSTDAPPEPASQPTAETTPTPNETEPQNAEPEAPSKPEEVPEPVVELEPSTDFSYVITTKVVYYAGGPQQARPADGELEEGTKVNVIEGAGSYTLIETQNGVRGYVETNAIGKP